MSARTVTATMTPVPSEDGQGWQVEFAWDTGKRQRLLHFQSKQEAEDWIAWNPAAWERAARQAQHRKRP